ncbi:MAG: hypothetical protein ACI9S8_002350 [Chlamydiales bacterium]|jgi:hypothetical protein
MDQHPRYMSEELREDFASVRGVFGTFGALSEELLSLQKRIDNVQRVLISGKGMLETNVRDYSSVFFEKKGIWLATTLKFSGLNSGKEEIDKSFYLIGSCGGKFRKCVMRWKVKKEKQILFENIKQ